MVNSEPTTPPPALTTHPSPGYPSLMLHPSRVRFCWMESPGSQAPAVPPSLALAKCYCPQYQLGTSAGDIVRPYPVKLTFTGQFS